MNKEMITVEMIKEMIRENDNLLRSESAFDSSDLAKLMKKKQVTPEGYAYVYNNAKCYSIRKYVMDKCGFTLKDYIQYGTMERVYYNSMVTEMFRRAGFFKSVEEFVSIIKEVYNVDLNSDTPYNDVNQMSEFSAFVNVISYNPVREDTPEAEVEALRKVYIDLFPYFFSLRKYHTQGNLGEVLYSTVNNVHAIDFDMVKNTINGLVISKSALLKSYALMFSRFSGRTGNSLKFMDLDEVIYKLLPAIKEVLGEEIIPGRTRDYSYEDFMETVMHFFGGGYRRSPVLTREQRDFLYDLLIKNTIDETPFKETPYRSYYNALAFNLVPDDEVDTLFMKLEKKFRKAIIIEDLLRNMDSKAQQTKVTQYITDAMISLGYNWSRVMVPEDKMYDVEYLKEMCKRISERNAGKSSSGVLFGTRWDDNTYTLLRIDVDKLPAEFFTEFELDINWVCLSRTKCLSLQFMKDHFNNIEFGNLQLGSKEVVDDELGGKLIEKFGNVYTVTEVLSRSKSLSKDFVAKNIKHIYEINCSRKMTTTIPIKLSEIVAAIA